MTTFIETFTGRTFRPLAPNAADIYVADIAHALANQCRFAGHTRAFYSVAQHSVLVSYESALPDKLWGLLHDASEAYLVDIPSPLKAQPEFAGYRAAEERVMTAVCSRFGLRLKMPASVARADAVLLATEARDLMHGDREYWSKLSALPLAQRIVPWSPAQAEYEFLRRFYLLRQGEEQAA